MGREFIGDCPTSGEDSEFDDFEAELAIKYIKQKCQPPRGVNVQVSWEDHELGSYPVISVVWNDYITDYPGEYIGKCISVAAAVLALLRAPVTLPGPQMP
jgi:hypothetical protein